jgi:polysaccharide chain length determinant protein (PEP-CTERM system associated)
MQPSPESYASIGRRALDIEDYLDILRRHKSWIFGPAFATLVLAVVVAFLWPDTFVSTAIIRVVPQQVPTNYVEPNVNSEMSQRINAIYQTISTRENLSNLITSLNLYARERQRQPMEDVIEDMRKAIRVEPVIPLAQQVKEVTAFSVSFSYSHRLLAHSVTEQLVSRFMSENTRERHNQAVQTTAFLDDQLQAAKKHLDTIESRLAQFRSAFAGRLPEQVQQNQQRLNAMETRIANLNAGLSRVGQEKMLLESDLRTLKAQRASLTPAPDQLAQRQQNERLIAVERDIMQLEGTLAVLRQQYKDTYPDVRRVKDRLELARNTRERIIKEEEERANKEKAAQGEAAAAQAYDPRFEREAQQLDAAIQRIETQLKAKDVEAEEHRKSIEAAERGVRGIQSRIEATPVSEQEYAQVIRDHENARLAYDDLNRKRAQSEIATELERRKQGETLELLEPASVPVSPTQPKRLIIVAAGAILGLVMGLFFAGAREAKDTSLKNLKDVRAYTQLTILGSVPLLENDLVVQRRRRLAWLAWSTACLVGIGIMTWSVVYYYTSQV